MRWNALHEGDVVDIIAPGWAVNQKTLKEGMDLLTSWGLQPRLPKALFGRHIFCANSDDKRWLHLKNALQAKDSKVIWCMRGGYGSLRLLPMLKKLKKPSQTKLLVGISDVTSLSVFLNESWNWPTLHGALLDRMGGQRLPKNIHREMKNILWGKQKQIEFKGLKPLNRAAQVSRNISGKITGGNLTTLQSAIGTPYDFSLKNKILFLEDIGERGYRLDRMLVHFLQAGKFKNCKAILLGQFTGGQEKDGRNLVWPALKTFAQEINIPVFSGVSSGHDVKLRPLPMNTLAKIKKSGSYRLIVESGVKEL